MGGHFNDRGIKEGGIDSGFVGRGGNRQELLRTVLLSWIVIFDSPNSQELPRDAEIVDPARLILNELQFTPVHKFHLVTSRPSHSLPLKFNSRPT